MSLKRRVAALEKHQAEVAAIRRTKAERDNEAKLHVFWDQVELQLQAKGHWSSPGEDFFRFVSKGIGFDYGRFLLALLSNDRPVLDEFMKAIFQQFSELEETWPTLISLCELRELLNANRL
jgi:hypothetical protein